MENNTKAEKNSGQGESTDAIFGTSSDSIVEGLHNSAFTESSEESGQANPGDDAIIVNEQEQNEIVNPDEEDFTTNIPEDAPSVASAKENQGIADDIIEGDVVDDGIDDETAPLKADN